MVIGQVIELGIDLVLVVSTLLLLGLSGFVWIEVLAALVPVSRQGQQFSLENCKIAILMPAHDEEAGLRETLTHLQAQVNQSDRLRLAEVNIVVVADNCTDATAAIAREFGVTVIERQDKARRGKGYALDYGLQFLEAAPPEVVVLMDADCQVGSGAIEALVDQVLATDRPAQATYLMEKPSQPSVKDGVSAFAFTVKNLVRPLGLSRFGLPCLLMGTGMAFPWRVIRSVNLASGHLVEDMKLSLDLTIAGFAPLYCPSARVLGRLPQQDRAANSQRTRWEHGHLQSILTYVPALLKAFLQKGRIEALPLALELAVPPLSLFVMLCLAASIIAVSWGLFSASWVPATLSSLTIVFLGTAVLLAWARFGQNDLRWQALLGIPMYILWKIPMYFKFLVRPQQDWVRTERDQVVVSIDGAAKGSEN
jgi:cellulose synthase/poly-beta-1,6-N-acetylglucosamine synthase-like glycosyltransferase